MIHPYTKFDDPTMYSCLDINSDVNLNVDADAHADADGRRGYANSPPQLRWGELTRGSEEPEALTLLKYYNNVR